MISSTISTSYDCVCDAKSVEIVLQGFQSFLFQVISKHTASVFHHLSDVTCLSTWSRGQIQHFFSHLRVKSQDWQERRGTLKHIVSGQVLRSSTDWYFGLIDLNTNFAPLSKWIKVNTSLNKALSKLLSSGLQGISSDGQRPLSLVGLEELNKLRRIEKVQEVSYKLEIIAIISMQKLSQLLNIIFSWLSLSQFDHIHQNGNGFLNLQINNADINWLIILLIFLSLFIILLLVLLSVFSLLFLFFLDKFLVWVVLLFSFFVFWKSLEFIFVKFLQFIFNNLLLLGFNYFLFSFLELILIFVVFFRYWFEGFSWNLFILFLEIHSIESFFIILVLSNDLENIFASISGCFFLFFLFFRERSNFHIFTRLFYLALLFNLLIFTHFILIVEMKFQLQ